MNRYAIRLLVRRLLWLAVVAGGLALLATVAVVGRHLLAPALAPVDPAPTVDAQTVARGAYLARAGNCAACHTTRGGLPYAGGRGIETPFGTVFAGNLTPEVETGIGGWSADAFWRAMHHGQSRDGRLLYPAFPYTSFTQIRRADSDALYAFLRSQPAVRLQNRPHELRWPYRTQVALAVWRELYFEARPFAPAHERSAEWNRGAYLVRALGHCGACHSARDALGGAADVQNLSGALMPGEGWYAPSLRASSEAGVAGWAPKQVVDLLKTGVAPHASTIGPMAEVVFDSMQYLSDDDLGAMAVFLTGLGQRPAAAPPAFEAADHRQMALGEQVYTQRCADCHGPRGEGAARAYPALAGNRAVTMASPVNLVQTILSGGFAPATAGNPQPFGMPPFRTLLSDDEVAAVSSFVRQSWGHRAAAVSALDVQRLR